MRCKYHHLERFLLFCFFVSSLLAVDHLVYASSAKIVASTQTVAAIVEMIVPEGVRVEFLSRGTEDPHYVEAKPSFMTRVRDADLVVEVGLELEAAWLENVLRGARNPKVLSGSKGHISLGDFVETLEKQEGRLDRGQGDVHPKGNPHFYLDPTRVQSLLPKLADKVSIVLPAHKDNIEKKLRASMELLEHQIRGWQEKLKIVEKPGDSQDSFDSGLSRENSNLAEKGESRHLGNSPAKGDLRIGDAKLNKVSLSAKKNVITFHRTLVYALNVFGFHLVGTLEPKPGIPPTVAHTLSLVGQVKRENVLCVLNEAHFDQAAAQKLAKATGIKMFVVPTEVGATPEVKDYISLIDAIVEKLRLCK